MADDKREPHDVLSEEDLPSLAEVAERDMLDALSGMGLTLVERKTVLWLIQLDALEPTDLHVLAGIIRKARVQGPTGTPPSLG